MRYLPFAILVITAASVAIAGAGPARAEVMTFGSGSNNFPASYTENGLRLTASGPVPHIDIINWDGNGEREVYLHRTSTTLTLTRSDGVAFNLESIDIEVVTSNWRNLVLSAAGYSSMTLSTVGTHSIGFVNVTAVVFTASTTAANSAVFDNIVTSVAGAPTIEDALGAIEDLVIEGTLKPGQANGLIKPLENALKSIDKENLEAACSQLDDFIGKAQQKADDGAYSQDDADALIEMAKAIQDDIGC